MRAIHRLAPVLLVASCVPLLSGCFQGLPPGTAADAAVTSAIEVTLAADPDVRGFAIDVSVQDGRATLAGVVRSERDAARAVELARSTPGVENIINRLVVGDPMLPHDSQRRREAEPADAGVLRRTATAVARDPELAGTGISIAVEGGVITLTGDVRSRQTREVAGEVVRQVEGVARVVNLLTVSGEVVATPTPAAPPPGV